MPHNDHDKLLAFPKIRKLKFEVLGGAFQVQVGNKRITHMAKKDMQKNIVF